MNNPSISEGTVVEIVEARVGRRRWSGQEKRSIVEETYELGNTLSSVARKHKLQPSQLFSWRRLYEEGALMGVSSESKVVPESELKKLQERINRLERLLGQKTEEVEVLKEAVRIGREKKLISRAALRKVDDFQ